MWQQRIRVAGEKTSISDLEGLKRCPGMWKALRPPDYIDDGESIMGNKNDGGKGPLGHGYEGLRLQNEQTPHTGDHRESVHPYEQTDSRLAEHLEFRRAPTNTGADKSAQASKLHLEVDALVDYIARRGLSTGEATVVLLQAGFQMGGRLDDGPDTVSSGFHGGGRRDN